MITIFGVTGYAGSHIAREATSRGLAVLGVARSEPTSTDGIEQRQGSLYDDALVAELAAASDALVVAVRAGADDHALAAAVPALLQAVEEHGSRLGVVGGASSLLTGGQRLIDTPEFPDAFRPEAVAQGAVLDALRADSSGADWFYLSPSQVFGSFAPGERTGVFRLGGDELLVGADGVSRVSGADYAIAFVDELVTPAHHRARFTVGY